MYDCVFNERPVLLVLPLTLGLLESHADVINTDITALPDAVFNALCKNIIFQLGCPFLPPVVFRDKVTYLPFLYDCRQFRLRD